MLAYSDDFSRISRIFDRRHGKTGRFLRPVPKGANTRPCNFRYGIHGTKGAAHCRDNTDKVAAGFHPDAPIHPLVIPANVLRDGFEQTEKRIDTLQELLGRDVATVNFESQFRVNVIRNGHDANLLATGYRQLASPRMEILLSV
ncbi:MAG: hypothetical protein V6Z86_05070 [Hyphomicrobiales bacterium]